jgi:rubrerythrin
MTERLDRIEAILERTAEKQERHADEIDTLLGAVSTTEVAVNNLVAELAETNQRFENLRQDAIADRQETAQKFNDAIAQMNTDREENRKSFDDTLTRIDAQQEVIQRLIMELLNTNRDATKLRDRVDNLEQAS